MMKIRIGTRASKLALIQALQVKESLLKHYHDLDIDLIKIQTTGDKLKNKPLINIGGKALFVKELEEALLKNEIDIAVHSLKDMPAEIMPSLTIMGFLKGEDPRDAFISEIASDIYSLPNRATIGTSSPRRASQLLRMRKDLQIVPLRGNVDTRIAKVKSGEVDATILAVAGLRRLGIKEYSIIDEEQIIPAVGQGVICAECSKDQDEICKMLHTITDQKTKKLMLVERGFIETINGDCSTPLGASTSYLEDSISIKAFLIENGKYASVHAIEKSSNPYELGKKIALSIKSQLS